MRTPFELLQLADLRRAGKAPGLPVFVTDNWVFWQNLTDCGALAIRASAEDWRCDWSPLSGLDVILAMRNVNTPANARLAVVIREARARRLRVLLDGALTTMLYAHPLELAA